jgi:hypothetical protein
MKIECFRTGQKPGAKQRTALITLCISVGAMITDPATAQSDIVQSPAVPAQARKGGFMVPKVVVLRTTTPGETDAHAIWTLRAALNVGALQCQYSPFLRTVKNYNEMLRHHSAELARAQATMVGHFRRYDGARGLSSFDQYTTRTYNSFSTLDAQYSFCEAVGLAGREVLLRPRGRMIEVATGLNPVLRAALSEPPPLPLFDLTALNGYSVSTLIMAPDQPERRRRR